MRIVLELRDQLLVSHAQTPFCTKGIQGKVGAMTTEWLVTQKFNQSWNPVMMLMIIITKVRLTTLLHSRF